MSRFLKTLAITLALGLSTASHAAENDMYSLQPCPDSLAVKDGEKTQKNWDLSISPYTHHWHDSDDHKNVFLVALDRHLAGNRFCGLALFTNSFGQPSAYGYVGQQWNNIAGNPKLFSKVSAGLIWGYRNEHQDAIPFNRYGIAPAIIPSLGYAFTPNESGQVFLLGTAGLTFAYVKSF
jgi:hypothetical protein